MEFRLEHDTMGEVRVPAAHKWGAQTQRSYENFKIGTQRMPAEIIRAFAVLKKCAAKTNEKLGRLDAEKAAIIAEVCDEILAGKWPDEFPLVIYQTGSGTQSNMNMNEVIAHIANEKLAERGSKTHIHPNDDVNRSQSSNDTFPTAMHIAAVQVLHEYLYPAVERLRATLQEKSDAFADIVKIGRTHLQDATPLTLGQEISAWVAMLTETAAMLRESEQKLYTLALGGTAVGTGLNAPRGFAEEVAATIAAETGHPFVTAANKFHALTSHDSFVYSHGAVEALAMNAMKLANDVRMLACGPRAGIHEILIPENEPGSSIMPGKVNPTQCEAVTMVAARVHGNAATISFAASQGAFQLNVYMPVLIASYIESVRLLGDALHSFDIHCAFGLEANRAQIEANVRNSLMLVTALAPHIGYEKAAEIAKKAHREESDLKTAAVALGYVTAEEYDRYVVPGEMIGPK
ncbi:MAG: class II fumarate hydratase [Veillonellaceae bacterium]|nr:class II fumarate hydratase [Veillonellaceae bacterium]